jgi:threonine aldolase
MAGSTRASFGSDNHAGAHPDVMAAVVGANNGWVTAYGDDPVTARAEDLFRQHFGDHVSVFPVFNGTGANVVSLSALLRPYEAVVCATTAHVNVDECGAPERLLGSKLVDVPAPEGKLTVEIADRAVWGIGDQHHVQAKVVTVTQSTELGTVYTLDELRTLADWAHSRDLYLHVDGARFCNAAATLGVGLGDVAATGIDVLSFGATKNGALGAEAVVVLRPEGRLAEALPFLRKQSMQLASKMRFVSAQMVALLEGDLWLRNAEHANAMAQRLATGLEGVDGVTVSYPVQANAVFAVLDRAHIDALQSRHTFYVWDEGLDQVRWMTSWATSEDDVDAFAADVLATTSR